MDAKNLYNWGRRYITIPLIGLILFVTYVVFFNDQNSVLDRVKYQQEIQRLEAEISDNLDSLSHYRTLNAALETDRDNIERVVREHYHMQRPNEDIYIFE